mmetsp:Transcript_25323/g.56029  ORF Transcript_25323/g.56029 Transcript_25323/m.56029 type:complete len:227 (+) Transcript_25323:1365-2045(+)
MGESLGLLAGRRAAGSSGPWIRSPAGSVPRPCLGRAGPQRLPGTPGHEPSSLCGRPSLWTLRPFRRQRFHASLCRGGRWCCHSHRASGRGERRASSAKSPLRLAWLLRPAGSHETTPPHRHTGHAACHGRQQPWPHPRWGRRLLPWPGWLRSSDAYASSAGLGPYALWRCLSGLSRPCCWEAGAVSPREPPWQHLWSSCPGGQHGQLWSQHARRHAHWPALTESRI